LKGDWKKVLTKPREVSRTSDTSLYVQKRRKRRSPLMMIGIIVPAILLVLAGSVFAWTRFASHAAAATNMNCTLIVPRNPLSAQGLATPYQFTATNPTDGPCNEANTDQSAFVQSTIYDPASGTFAVYNPLVIDKGTQPAVKPIVPMLPKGAVVGIWFGFNATNLQLQGAGRDSLAAGRCVNGLGKSLFTQFAYCNAVAFWATVNHDLAAGKFKVPVLKMAKDGQVCPTTRDFGIIDQDQSDNVQTQYLADGKGRIAQFSAANQASLKNATKIANPSDNALLTNFIDPALGCQDWTAPDLSNDGQPTASLALDELQAAQDQKAPAALVPLNDPMTTLTDAKGNAIPNLAKTDLYRAGVNQPIAFNDATASGKAYCQNFVHVGMPRIILDKQFTIGLPSPDTGAANSLFTFLAQRAQGSFDNLGCKDLLHMDNPVKTVTNKDGVVTSATFNQQAIGVPVQPNPPTNAPNCNINGTTIKGCSGTTRINGQTCLVSFANNTVKLTCPHAYKRQ
jgi:hypothetical protein